MQLGLTDAILWCSGLVTSVVLLTVLLAKKRLFSEPVFTCWIAFDVISTVLLFMVYHAGSPHLYFVAYWVSVLFDFLLQIGVIAELAWSIFHRRGGWIHRATSRFALFALLALISSIAVALLIKPAATKPLDSLFARANLFMTMVFCTGFLCLISVSRQLGVSWSTRTMRTAYGFFVWIIVSFSADTLHTFWQFSYAFTGLEHTRTIASQLVTLYWTFLQFRSSTEEVTRSHNMLSDMAVLASRLRTTSRVEVGR